MHKEKTEWHKIWCSQIYTDCEDCRLRRDENRFVRSMSSDELAVGVVEGDDVLLSHVTHFLAAHAVSQLAFGGQWGRFAVYVDVPVEMKLCVNFLS